MADTAPYHMPDGLAFNENIDFQIDLTRELSGRNAGADDSIASVVWTIPVGLLQGTTTHSVNTATIYLSADTGAGAALGSTYTVNALIATASRTYDRSFSVTIVNK